MWVISEGKSRPWAWGVSFYSSGKFYRLRSWRNIPAISGKGLWFPGTGPLPTFWPCGRGARGVLPSLLLYSSECVSRLQVKWRSTRPPSCAYLGLVSLHHVFGLCHSFKGWALHPPVSLSLYGVGVQSLHYALIYVTFRHPGHYTWRKQENKMLTDHDMYDVQKSDSRLYVHTILCVTWSCERKSGNQFHS